MKSEDGPLLAIKDESKVANRDWIDRQTCSLFHIMTNVFMIRNYFDKNALKMNCAKNSL